MVTPPLRYAPPRPTSYVLPILTSLILLLCALFHPARSQDDGGGNDPGYRAPMRNITCPGPAPPFRLPIYPTLDLNSLTLQTLCAAPRYGGLPAFSLFDLPVEAAIRFSTGFYCLGPLHPENAPRSTLPDVAFDTSPLPPVVPSTLFDWVRLNLFCRERCFCSNVTGTSIALKPYGFTDSQRLLPVALGFQPYSVRELRLHEDNRLTRLPFAISNLPKSAIIWHSQRRAQSSVRGELTSDQVTISLSPRNWIACLPHTPIPPLRMPPPYTDHNSDFRSLRELCAVSLDGGNPGANAGAYCHPASPHARGTPRRKSQLWFSDAATPRLEWTWTHGFRFAAQLRAYCFAFCWCASEEPQPIEDRAGYAFLRLLEDVDLVRLPSGQGVISRKGGGEVVLPKMGAGHRSCAQDTSGSCPAAGEGGDGQYDYWPTAVLGPAPGADPPAGRRERVVALRKRPGQDLLGDRAPPMCGQTCDGPAIGTCEGAERGGGDGCACVSLTREKAERLGLMSIGGGAGEGEGGSVRGPGGAEWRVRDRRRGVGFCLALGLIRSGRSGLGRRGSVEEWECFCKGGEVATECCGENLSATFALRVG